MTPPISVKQQAFNGLATSTPSAEAKVLAPANPRLAQRIDSMYNQDQLPFQEAQAMRVPSDSVVSRSHRVYRRNHMELQQILQQYGYPGYALVGPEATSNFNTMVLHCFFDVPFQNTVLELFQAEATRYPALRQDERYLRKLAYLTDKVLSNSGKLQVYGTQLNYSPEKGAFLLPVQHAATLNQRRAQMRMEPVEEYLKKATEVHRQMNPQR